jgi:hypothetical protein
MNELMDCHLTSYRHRHYPVHPSVFVVVVVSEQRYQLSPSTRGGYQRSQHQRKEVSQGRPAVSPVVQARGEVHKHVDVNSLASTGRITLKSGACSATFHSVQPCPPPPPQERLLRRLNGAINTFCPALLSTGLDSLFIF